MFPSPRLCFIMSFYYKSSVPTTLESLSYRQSRTPRQGRSAPLRFMSAVVRGCSTFPLRRAPRYSSKRPRRSKTQYNFCSSVTSPPAHRPLRPLRQKTKCVNIHSVIYMLSSSTVKPHAAEEVINPFCDFHAQPDGFLACLSGKIKAEKEPDNRCAP